jgi:hypothetical protein
MQYEKQDKISRLLELWLIVSWKVLIKSGATRDIFGFEKSF